MKSAMLDEITIKKVRNFIKRKGFVKGLVIITKRIIVYVAMAPVLFILFLLRPFILIRVQSLFSSRIGHFALNNEMYLCECDNGLHQPQTFDIFFHTKPICNLQLKKMWDSKLRICGFARYIQEAIEFYPGFQRHLINTSPRNRHGVFADCKTHLSFTQEELEYGKAFLEKAGMLGSKYVGVICRDNEYLKKSLPGNDWSYHDYRDVDIDNYIPALEVLADRGYYVLRMGAAVSKRINSYHPRVIDYAMNGMRTEFLDIFLPANCYFFISNGTGLDAIAKVFRRPILYVNLIPLEYIRAECSYDLSIPKKIWMRDGRRFMTFREILKSGVGNFSYGEQYEKHNLEVVDNTPEEIEAAAIEMEQRMKGTWETTEDDEELQRRFWSLFKPSDTNRVFRSRIGRDFLRHNTELLE